MTLRYTFFLVSFLFCIHFKAVLAATPKQKRVRRYSSTQSKRKAISPSKTASQAAGAASSNTPAQQVLVPTTRQNEIKEHRHVAEEMVMQRAWMYSAVLPGWGQVYNEHYWKVPVIYVGFAGFFGGAIYYHREYLQFKRELMEKRRGISLENYVDECRTGRDLYIILAALWYVVNIFDAYVGASLKTFTLSDDISMDIQPTVIPTTRNPPIIGLSLTLRFQNENTVDRLWKDGASH